MHYSTEECAENLSAALDAVEQYVRHFVRVPESAVPAVCAWIAHTYLIDENGFPAGVTPRLGFTSRKRGGGKSTALGVVYRLSRHGKMVMLPSKAGWMNAIERDHATLCLEEADKTFPKENSRIEIQAAINSGYAPDGGSILHGNREVPTHAFTAFAGIGPVLEVNPGLEPLWHRTIKVEMEPVFGVRFPEYDIELHGRMTSYLKQVLTSATELATIIYGEGLRALSPALLPDMDARRDQIWRVLRRIGMAAGPEWSQRIDASCVDMESGRSGAAPILSQQQRIWADVRAVTHGESQVGTQELINRLRQLPDSPWAFLWPKAESPGVARELATLLAPHGLVPDIIRVPMPGGMGTIKERGYRLTDHAACGVCTDDSLVARTPLPPAQMPEHGTDAPDAPLTLPLTVPGDTEEDPAVTLHMTHVSPRQTPSAPAVPLFAPPSF